MRKPVVSFFFILLVSITFAVPPALLVVLAGVFVNHGAALRAGSRRFKLYLRTKRWFNGIRSGRVWLRTYLRKILRDIRSFFLEKYASRKVLFWMCGLALCASAAFLIWHVRTESVKNYLGYCFTEVLATIVLGVAVLALAWLLLPIELLASSTFVKFSLSIIVSACLLYSRLLATDFFSAAFPFPPSYMPNAFWIGTILVASSFTSLVFAPLALVFETAALFALGTANFKKKDAGLWVFAGITAAGLVCAWLASLAVFEGIRPKGQLFMIKLAEQYDFTTNHMCEAAKEEKVLFIDNVADRAIAATFPGISPIKARDMGDKELKAYMPTKFHMVRCNPLPVAAASSGWCEDSSRPEDASRFGFCGSDRMAAQSTRSDASTSALTAPACCESRRRTGSTR